MAACPNGRDPSVPLDPLVGGRKALGTSSPLPTVPQVVAERDPPLGPLPLGAPYGGFPSLALPRSLPILFSKPLSTDCTGGLAHLP